MVGVGSNAPKIRGDRVFGRLHRLIHGVLWSGRRTRAHVNCRGLFVPFLINEQGFFYEARDRDRRGEGMKGRA